MLLSSYCACARYPQLIDSLWPQRLKGRQTYKSVIQHKMVREKVPKRHILEGAAKSAERVDLGLGRSKEIEFQVEKTACTKV